jgi:hypothetical protein
MNQVKLYNNNILCCNGIIKNPFKKFKNITICPIFGSFPNIIIDDMIIYTRYYMNCVNIMSYVAFNKHKYNTKILNETNILYKFPNDTHNTRNAHDVNIISCKDLIIVSNHDKIIIFRYENNFMTKINEYIISHRSHISRSWMVTKDNYLIDICKTHIY